MKVRKYRDMNLEGQGGERTKWNTQTIENTEREREREGGYGEEMGNRWSAERMNKQERMREKEGEGNI
jgi:hypothetical protein